MINILRNSVKFTFDGEISLSAKIIHYGMRSPSSLQLEFYDSGEGIEEADIKKLFKIFGKLKDPR